MTYNVLMGTLNPTHSLTHSICAYKRTRANASALHTAFVNVVITYSDVKKCDVDSKLKRQLLP